VRPDQVESLLDQYHALDARAPSEVPRRRKRTNPEPHEILAAIVRADITPAQQAKRLLRLALATMVNKTRYNESEPEIGAEPPGC